MEPKQKAVDVVKKFIAKYGLDVDDDNAVLTVHLMNTHLIDVHRALDQSSRGGGGDHGIDGWCFNSESGELFIYQSKFSESKALVLTGLDDLRNAQIWLEQVLVKGSIDNLPHNNCLYNLYSELGRVKNHIKKITFVLVSLFDTNELEDTSDYQQFSRELTKSELMSYLKKSSARMDFYAETYNFEASLPASIKRYPIPVLSGSRVVLRKNAHLDLAYVSLRTLVDLYRQRGHILFDKNVRLSLMKTKEAKDRLVHPLFETFDNICEGKLNANIFPFYHVGVTIAAKGRDDSEENHTLSLEAPSVINGAQTISIADEYLRNIEKKGDTALLEQFNDVKVIAKIVIGTSDDELREITNANNRQNPIQNWQLFSNDPVHIEIEHALKEFGVFYERQQGKFDTLMTRTETVGLYPNTNATYIKVEELGQIVCLSRKNLQWAAKPGEIFLNKKNHDSIFDKFVARSPRDIILAHNMFMAMKRALTNYLEIPAHASDGNTQVIFKKPIVKTCAHYLSLLWFYQAREKRNLRSEYSRMLNKKAASSLIDEFESFYRRIVSKFRDWYMRESKQLKVNVSTTKLESFLHDLCVEFGIDDVGPVPFTSRATSWTENN